MAYRERLTWEGGKEVYITRPTSPVQVVDVVGSDTALVTLNVHDERLLPSNYADAEGTPLPLLGSDDFRLDLSKRTEVPMGFWHRNIDRDEVIICVKGGMTWDTELGTVTIKPGDVLVLPRGLAHRAVPPEGSDSENILIELKVHGNVKPLGTAAELLKATAAQRDGTVFDGG
jgi:mannose-6-phosphate isomerase-like protein (cupin superfamily)